MYLEVVFPVNIGSGKIILDLECRVPNLDGQTILQVEEARLADVLQLGAGLTDLGLLEPHFCPRAPAEDCVGPRAYLAFLAVLLLRHPDVGIVSETCLTQYWEVRILPVLSVVQIGILRCRHA